MSLLSTLLLETCQAQTLLRSVICSLPNRCNITASGVWPHEGSLLVIEKPHGLNMSHLIGRTYFTSRILAARESEKHSFGFVVSAVEEPTLGVLLWVVLCNPKEQKISAPSRLCSSLCSFLSPQFLGFDIKCGTGVQPWLALPFSSCGTLDKSPNLSDLIILI